jgi:hypothetical protein
MYSMENSTYLVTCSTLSYTWQAFLHEGQARAFAERIARQNAGHHVEVAKIIAVVTEPLMPLVWSNGATTDSDTSQQLDGLCTPQAMRDASQAIRDASNDKAACGATGSPHPQGGGYRE